MKEEVPLRAPAMIERAAPQARGQELFPVSARMLNGSQAGDLAASRAANLFQRASCSGQSLISRSTRFFTVWRDINAISIQIARLTMLHPL